MGSAIANRFAQLGYAVCGWTRSGIDPGAALALGIAPTASHAQLAQDSDIIFLSLFDDAAVRDVVSMLCEGDLSGKMIIDTSTVDPGLLRELIGRVRRAGGAALDAPISGGPEMVLDGSCGMFVGGEEADFTQVQSTLSALSGRVLHIGPLGSGMAMKVVNNAMLQGYWVTLTEVARIAKRAGLELEAAMKIIAGGPAATPMFKARIEKILGNDTAVGFSVAGGAKDSNVFVGTAQALGVDTPTLCLAQHMFHRACKEGLGGEDVAVLIANAYRDA
jgi:3-hydroxyisobutyrate dehydrogenase